MTPEQERILKLGEVEFEDIKDEDVITFDHFDQGFGIRGWFYLYDLDGFLKDIKCGKAIPLSENKFKRPISRRWKAYLESEFKTVSKPIIKPIPKPIQPIKILIQQSSETHLKREKKKRILSPEERARRADHMRRVATERWAKLKNKNV